MERCEGLAHLCGSTRTYIECMYIPSWGLGGRYSTGQDVAFELHTYLPTSMDTRLHYDYNIFTRAETREMVMFLGASLLRQAGFHARDWLICCKVEHVPSTERNGSVIKVACHPVLSGTSPILSDAHNLWVIERHVHVDSRYPYMPPCHACPAIIAPNHPTFNSLLKHDSDGEAVPRH